jgi:hypothetical protein
MRQFLRPARLRSWFSVLVMAFAWTESLSAAAKQRTYDLPLPRAVRSGETLAVRVSVGPLKTHLRIIVRIRNGEIAGTVSPFGAQARQGPAIYTIPLAAGAVKDGVVRLLVEVEDKNAGTRAPTAEEVRNITLAYVAVTGSSGKDRSVTR